MNFLAHFYLSGEDKNSLVGNFLGEFVRGRDFSAYPERFHAGIRLHRNIDSFTDQHPEVQALNAKLRPYAGPYAPVASDILMDYALAKRWSDFHSKSLQDFETQSFETLHTAQRFFPERAVRTLFYMEKYRWLSHYAEISAMAQTLRQVAKRTRKPHFLETMADHMPSLLPEVEVHFSRFFPEVVRSLAVG